MSDGWVTGWVTIYLFTCCHILSDGWVTIHLLTCRHVLSDGWETGWVTIYLLTCCHVMSDGWVTGWVTIYLLTCCHVLSDGWETGWVTIYLLTCRHFLSDGWVTGWVTIYLVDVMKCLGYPTFVPPDQTPGQGLLSVLKGTVRFCKNSFLTYIVKNCTVYFKYFTVENMLIGLRICTW